MDLGKFFVNLAAKAKEWGGYFLIFLGVILLIWAGIMIFKAFAQHGRGQSNWLMIVFMVLIGGYMMVKGFQGMEQLADIGASTIEQLSQ